MKGRKTELKLHFYQDIPMSNNELMQWSPHLRRYVYRNKRVHVLYMIVPVEQIKNKYSLGQFVMENLYEGNFSIQGYSHRKTPTHVGFSRVLARVHIFRRSDERLIAKVYDYNGISRYWFWEKQ